MRNSSATAERSMQDDNDRARCQRERGRCFELLENQRSRCAPVPSAGVVATEARVGQGARPANRRTIGNFQRPLLDDSQKVAGRDRSDRSVVSLNVRL